MSEFPKHLLNMRMHRFFAFHVEPTKGWARTPHQLLGMSARIASCSTWNQGRDAPALHAGASA
ncbi:hypothetical protein A176_007046 [Myxococcus hansupus]|uniref:Uncharacterized protein n=1 Tax=Pseudomyxococcus hansupus TaxID=1297742 RepID=A0A0H4X4J6_9BACT|nr:hypothetical protein A176_007046 [Myxococcus hansupus]